MPRCSRALLGVALALVLITLIVVPLQVFLSGRNAKRIFTLDDYFNDTIRYNVYNLRWISDTEYLHKTKEGHVFLYNVETRNSSEFLNNKTFVQVDATDYLVSADRKFVCLESNYSKKWRHSFTASYSIYDRENSRFVTPSSIPQNIQYLLWAPTGNELAFVWNYNVYIKLLATSDAIKVTTNGEENKILNGIPDWVYEEEMFSSNDAMWWSPSGKFLAYVEFNDTEVHTIEFSWYGSDQYPRTVIVPYPKAGTTIPKAKLFVVDSEDTSRVMQILVPHSIGESDHYLSTVTWVTDERIAVQWVKRSQNHVLLQVYDFDGNSWNANWYSPLHPFFAADNTSFYKIMSDSNGYKHIHYVNAGTATPITSGPWEDIYISKVTKDAIYYVSNEHLRRPGQRNVYKIEIGKSHSAPRCLTCAVQEERCQYNFAYFSQDATYYRMGCYGPGLPLFTIRDTQNPGSDIEVLEDNSALERILAEFKMPTMLRGTVNVGGFELWYQMMLPPNFDKSKKYPLLIDVYAGPCSQKADYRFRLNWGSYLASSENIITASFDGRGSGYQGDKILHSIYRRLGTYEVEDQLSAVRKFIDMGFIDKKRIAIWGWSYGGYVTSMALGSGSGLFKCGVAVAPVCSWEYYDSVYTERYMSRPKDNAEFYKNSTVASRAKNFKSVEYLLIHGTADDNVHFQQAAQISKALVEEQVDFEAMWYTDKNHELGGSAYRHVFTHMSHFLQKCLKETK
ncbi:dipeptidyl peptidase 4 isoform X2 [Scleropages formosus]|uniref:Dipeptidyl peptidase 4-like n=1 Tax=Scleropages formosus TaxID=113540 RepID=A0A8C9SH10_SCLFO|nr:dipeptidyl peptidase 4-like isoform X2 [Scleropages formosus]